MLTGFNLDIHSQVKVLENIVLSTGIINTVIERAKLFNIDNYYIGAGCIAQTV